MSRDFPTAKEVADGKRKAMLSAQAIAQAEAAHNQAILADLNVFTHLEPNAHRWDVSGSVTTACLEEWADATRRKTRTMT